MNEIRQDTLSSCWKKMWMLNLTGTECANEGNSDHELRFETKNNKIRRKKLISNKWENNDTIYLQPSQPIVVVVNKYIILDSLQYESLTFQNCSRTSKVALLKNKQKCPPNTLQFILSKYQAAVKRTLRLTEHWRLEPDFRISQIW